MVGRTFLGRHDLRGKVKKSQFVLHAVRGGGTRGTENHKSFFISFLFFLIYRRFISRFVPTFFFFNTSLDIINYSETPLKRTLRGLACSRLRDSLVR